jgi:hypothetical protein
MLRHGMLANLPRFIVSSGKRVLHLVVQFCSFASSPRGDITYPTQSPLAFVTCSPLHHHPPVWSFPPRPDCGNMRLVPQI